jgi:hypothetical protein
MSLAAVYAHRELIEKAGLTFCYCNKTGQNLRLHLVPSEQIQHGRQYPVFIERQDGQWLRKYLLGSELIFVACLAR